jgi:hypothetical protein
VCAEVSLMSTAALSGTAMGADVQAPSRERVNSAARPRTLSSEVTTRPSRVAETSCTDWRAAGANTMAGRSASGLAIACARSIATSMPWTNCGPAAGQSSSSLTISWPSNSSSMAALRGRPSVFTPDGVSRLVSDSKNVKPRWSATTRWPRASDIACTSTETSLGLPRNTSTAADSGRPRRRRLTTYG